VNESKRRLEVQGPPLLTVEIVAKANLLDHQAHELHIVLLPDQSGGIEEVNDHQLDVDHELGGSIEVVFQVGQQSQQAVEQE